MNIIAIEVYPTRFINTSNSVGVFSPCARFWHTFATIFPRKNWQHVLSDSRRMFTLASNQIRCALCIYFAASAIFCSCGNWAAPDKNGSNCTPDLIRAIFTTLSGVDAFSRRKICTLRAAPTSFYVHIFWKASKVHFPRAS